MRASDDVIAILKAVRRCAIDTVAEPSIYGNAFAMASPGRIQACTTVLNPPTASNNIYAIEAPPSGKGVYVAPRSNGNPLATVPHTACLPACLPAGLSIFRAVSFSFSRPSSSLPLFLLHRLPLFLSPPLSLAWCQGVALATAPCGSAAAYCTLITPTCAHSCHRHRFGSIQVHRAASQVCPSLCVCCICCDQNSGGRRHRGNRRQLQWHGRNR